MSFAIHFSPYFHSISVSTPMTRSLCTCVSVFPFLLQYVYGQYISYTSQKAFIVTRRVSFKYTTKHTYRHTLTHRESLPPPHTHTHTLSFFSLPYYFTLSVSFACLYSLDIIIHLYARVSCVLQFLAQHTHTPHHTIHTYICSIGVYMYFWIEYLRDEHRKKIA